MGVKCDSNDSRSGFQIFAASPRANGSNRAQEEKDSQSECVSVGDSRSSIGRHRWHLGQDGHLGHLGHSRIEGKSDDVLMDSCTCCGPVDPVSKHWTRLDGTRSKKDSCSRRAAEKPNLFLPAISKVLALSVVC